MFVQYNSDLGKDVLYKISKPVKDIKSSEIQSLIEEMKEKMRGSGIGLAANQVGKPLQLFMIEFSPDPKNEAHTTRYKGIKASVPFQVFINPKILEASHEKVSFWHGCLSTLDRDKGLLATYKWIKYEAYNSKNEKITGTLEGLAAVIFQHEFRHLLGSLYIHRAKTFKTEEELSHLFASGALKPYDNADETMPHLIGDYIVGESLEDYGKRQNKSSQKEAPESCGKL